MTPVIRMRVLVFADWYLPGFKAGGPIRSIANMVEALGDDFNFKVITRDRDWLQATPYPAIATGVWQSVGKAQVMYLTPQNLRLEVFSKFIRDAEPDILYLNSLFSPRFCLRPLILRRMGRIDSVPVILAPRGELSQNALALKGLKKRLNMAVAKSLGLYRDVIWQASTVYEATDIRRWFGNHVPVVVASDVPAQVSGVNGEMLRREKVAGQLKIVFLSRISRMKNVDGALAMLQGLKGEIQFDIYGPLENKDRDYWAECQKIISLLQPNIKVKYWGGIEYSQVAFIMREHDLFFLPTLGENFGHVILDALQSGCPVLISDRTPWRDLEAKGVGWDFPLSEPDRFRRAIEACIEMGPQEHAGLSTAAVSFAREVAQDQSVIQQNRNLFECALTKLPSAPIQD